MEIEHHSQSPIHVSMEEMPSKVLDSIITSDQYISEPEEEIDLMCSESIEDFDGVWDGDSLENRPDIQKTNQYLVKPVARRKLDTLPPNSTSVSNSYRAGDPPEENPYISYLVRQFNGDSGDRLNCDADEVPSSDSDQDISDIHDHDIVQTEPVNPPSPLRERLTMVDSFNETSVSDVIIFRDESLTPYLERSPPGSTSPSLDGSQSDRDSPRSLSPFSDHVVPCYADEARIRIMRSCDTSDDHIVPEFASYIEE